MLAAGCTGDPGTQTAASLDGSDDEVQLASEVTPAGASPVLVRDGYVFLSASTSGSTAQ